MCGEERFLCVCVCVCSHDAVSAATGILPLRQGLDVDIQVLDLLPDGAQGRRRHVLRQLRETHRMSKHTHSRHVRHQLRGQGGLG